MQRQRAGAVMAVLLLATGARAQLPDLQPGRNFTATANFGLNSSANIDGGDVDNDGDLDVVVANGMDSGNQPERIFINQGGLQGGSMGAFVEETATRFAGFASDRSRDIEFVDLENDGDLDLLVVNTAGASGAPNRLYVNLGGDQAGSLGFYTEETNTRWGSLVSVPSAQQILGGNVGPYNGWSFDGDFADLDDDGDSDLFLASSGVGFTGTEESRVFLNDGGVLDELWPWADPDADVKLHSADADLADIDGDFDIDILTSSRNSQARVYVNNQVGALGGSFFQDVTQSAYYDTGATMSGLKNYATEFTDLDGDGDLDQWMTNWNSDQDAILRNDGSGASGVAFQETTTLIQGDPVVDEEGADFLDYDGDGDLDVIMANFSGTNFIYQSALAQGFDPLTQGLYHRTGIAGQSPGFETPSGIAGALTTLDVDSGDVDGDGDDDALVANDSNQQNWLYTNVLGVPDSHAPTFAAVTDQDDTAVFAPVVIHAAVRDNHAPYAVGRHDTRLIWSVDGGTETTTPMFSQGGQQFRGTIPAVIGSVSYRVECTDHAGNTGVSETLGYSMGNTPWSSLGFALPGSFGPPDLDGTGTLAAGSPGSLALTDAAHFATSLLLVSLASNPTPFKGGTVAAVPSILVLAFSTNGTGAFTLPWSAWPAGVPSGTVLVFQVLVNDPAAVKDVALSNALQAVTP